MIVFSLLIDLGKFMTVLFLFLIGFSMLVTAMNTPFFELLPEVRVYLEMYNVCQYFLAFRMKVLMLWTNLFFVQHILQPQKQQVKFRIYTQYDV